MRNRIWILVAILMAVSGLAALYFSFSNVYGHKKITVKAGKNDYLKDIRSFSEFMAIQGSPLSGKMNNVLCVKLVQDADNGTLYFINSVKYKYHYDFCCKVMGDDIPLELYNTINYGNALQRKYVLASLNYYQQSHTYTIELSSEDRATAPMLIDLVKTAQKHISMRDSVRLLINSANLLQLDRDSKLNIPKIYPSDIYAGQTYQLLNPGETYGILQDASTLSESTDTRKSILLMKGTPVNVPICAGIITNTLQTPLSHISVLCHNRNIPSATDVNIYTRTDAKQLMGKPVKMIVNTSGITIHPATLQAVDSFALAAIGAQAVTLQYNLSVKELVPVKKLGIKWSAAVGNKAAGMGELANVASRWNSNFHVPEGAFAIPFYYYHQHISIPAIKAQIETLWQLEKLNAPKDKVDEQLKAIRSAIKKHPLSPVLLQMVQQQITANGTWTSYRFRSSSNAEDAAGFSGAGLYESKTGTVHDTAKPIDAAIKKVWASAWGEAAYYERKACHIDDRGMMMGILAHRSFPDEAANGVAITKNIYRNGFPGFTINVQVGEVPVVAPPDSVICQQMICMKGYEVDPTNFDVATEYITMSNLNRNQPILTKKQVKGLYDALAAVKSHYQHIAKHTDAPAEDLGLDIEFKFDKNGLLYLKQVRPYR